MTMDQRLGELGIKTATITDLLAGYIPTGDGEGVRAAALLDIIRETAGGSYSVGQAPRINSPKSAGQYLQQKFVGMTEEVFGVLSLNTKGDLLANTIIGKGTCMAVIISSREVYREALRQGAVSVLCYHNHPSGDPTPSREDRDLTQRLRSAGEALGIALVDHIIIGLDRFHSFRAAEGSDQNG